MVTHVGFEWDFNSQIVPRVAGATAEVSNAGEREELKVRIWEYLGNWEQTDKKEKGGLLGRFSPPEAEAR